MHLIHPKTKSNEFLFPDRYKYSFSGLLIDKLIEIQDKKAIDIAHIESNELLYLTKYIKYIPIVYTEHDISILSPDKSYYSKRQNSPIMGIIDYFKIVRYHKSVYEKIDKVVVLSKEDIKLIKAFSPACDFSFIPTGVDLAHFTFREKYNEVNKSLIFVGHYPHYPNEEAAVYFVRHIYAPIKKQFPGVRLKLVGSDPTEAILKLSQVDGVDVIGTVDDVNPYLQQASVFVNAFQRSAGIKGKVLEAMATGTPVVCTSRGAYGIDAVSGKDIFIADKPKDFARRVIELLGNRELYNKIAYNARNLAEERYDWDKIARKLGKTYRDITGDVQYADKHEYLSCLKDEDIHNDKQFDTSKQETREIGIIEKSLDVPSRNNNIEVSDIIEKVNKVVDFSLECLSKDVKLQVNSDPEELHIELTHLCNSKCVMCDIWDYHPRNNKSVKDELSLKEIKDFIEKSKRLRNIKTVVLSGGEPFLKPELVEICSFIGEAFPRSSVGILTNGLDTDEILEGVKAISESSRVSSLWIGSSLDGVGESYDRIRGTNGGFRRFAKTIECLKRQFPKLNLSITFVLTPFNADQLVPSWEFARDNGLDFFAQFVVPKKARSVDVFAWDGIDFCQIENDIALIIKEIIERTQSLKSFYDSLNVLSDKISLITKIYYWSRLVNFQKTSRGFMGKCDAGYKFAMFDPYGNMFFCPLQKDKIAGNVRNKDFDTLWVSGEARDIRRNIEMNNCSCWLVCTIFPAVGRALTLYGDRSAVALRQDSKPEAIKIRPHAEIGNITISPPESDNLKPNSELNNLEFENKKCILGSTPQGITLGTNSECNAKCVFCLEGKYRSFSLDLYRNYFEPRLEYMLNRADYLSFCGMGEVLLIPEIENFLEYLNKKYSSKNKILTTNGLALNNKNIAQRILRNKYSLQISLHASSSALHEHITGIKGGFEEITRNIKELAAKRKDKQSPYITLVFVINTLNIEDLPAFVELAAALGVDCIQCNYLTIFKESHLKLSCFFKQELTNKMFELAEQKAGELNVILNLPPKFSARRYPGSKCGDPWKHLYIDTEGAVLPCCYSGEHYGEIKKEDISSIWNNNKFKRLRTDLASESPLQMCKYCVNAKQENVNYLSAHVSFRPEVQKIILGP